MKASSLYFSLASVFGAVAALDATSTYIVPTAPVDADVSIATNAVVSTAFDGPKVSAVNGSTFDWWYFDVVSAKASISLVFQTGTTASVGYPSVLELTNYIQVAGIWPNGTQFSVPFVPSGPAVVTTVGDGSSANFTGTGFSWTSTPNLSKYFITIDALETYGIKGTISFRSLAPAHYGLGSVADRSSSELLTPKLGWANAVPDAESHVDLIVGGEQLKFSGRGYHDKNWGSQALNDIVENWYWGHAAVGPYSIVFFDALDHNGVEYTAAYIAESGSPIKVGPTAIVRPFGDGITYPQTNSSIIPDGFNIVIDVGSRGVFEFNTTSRIIAETLDDGGYGYTRAQAHFVGGQVGGKKYTGYGLWDWQHFYQ
ncbi:hypothetical protein V1514DRAFT_189721 [Lipomyces japonicus]|uniref:uncharacterized protein n=1 Tax=Lipomyces japonicus TaxID=56871 RepID=UPI0034CE04D3